MKRGFDKRGLCKLRRRSLTEVFRRMWLIAGFDLIGHFSTHFHVPLQVLIAT